MWRYAYKTVFMLMSAKHDIPKLYKSELMKLPIVSAFQMKVFNSNVHTVTSINEID